MATFDPNTTTDPVPQRSSAGNADRAAQDPFTNGSIAHPEQRRTSQRYSSYDSLKFAQHHPSASPTSAKRALEAHLTETDRRLEEASKLGTALVKQRRELSERLKEVEQQQDSREIGAELGQKLAEVEKEYNELGRESARAFLAPKSRHVGGEDSSHASLGTDSKVIESTSSQKDVANVVIRPLPAPPSFRVKEAIHHPKSTSLPGNSGTNRPIGSMTLNL